ncbi:unnamed protein product [Sphagnum balticum]
MDARAKANLKSERGIAMVEAMAFMIGFVILTAYSIDFFTIVHTGILNSTASRTYLFETLQHRSDVYRMRQTEEVNKGSGGQYNATLDFTNVHQRFHAVTDESQSISDVSNVPAAGRMLSQAQDTTRSMSDSTLDSQKNQTSTIWIKTGYGICLDSGCPTPAPGSGS